MRLVERSLNCILDGPAIAACLFRLCGVKRFTFEEHETKETVEQGRHLLLAGGLS